MEAASAESVKPRHDAPHGMEPYDLGGPNDLGALSDEQQKKLNDFKVSMAGNLRLLVNVELPLCRHTIY